MILDLNGTLLARHRSSSHSTWIVRPHLRNFLDYCFLNHTVMMWSSARPDNVRRMVADILTPQQQRALIAEWGRNTLGLSSEDYHEKVQVYKQLSKVWGNEGVQKSCPGYEKGERWGQHNTVLVDDGEEKAKAEPWNLVLVPEFVKTVVSKCGKRKKAETDVLSQVVGWIEEARRWSDVSAFVHAMGERFVVDKGWKWEWAVLNADQNGWSVDWEALGAIVGGEGSSVVERQQGRRNTVQGLEVTDQVSESEKDSGNEGGVKLPLHHNR